MGSPPDDGELAVGGADDQDVLCRRDGCESDGSSSNAVPLEHRRRHTLAKRPSALQLSAHLGRGLHQDSWARSLIDLFSKDA